LAVIPHAAYNHMDVLVLRIVMRDRDPFEIDKGFISFAARKCRRTGKRLEAAKVMKPRSELNRETEAGL
jgi:hypothetical protein